MSRGARGEHTGRFFKELINDAAYFGRGSAKEEPPLDAQLGLLATEQVRQAPYKSYKQTDMQGRQSGEFSSTRGDQTQRLEARPGVLGCLGGSALPSFLLRTPSCGTETVQLAWGGEPAFGNRDRGPSPGQGLL